MSGTFAGEVAKDYGRDTVDDTGRAARRIAAAVALSLLAHALVLTLERNTAQRDTPEAPRSIAVRLRPPPPAPQVEEAPAPTPVPQPRPAKPRRPRPVIAVPFAPAAPLAPDPFVVEQAPEPPPTDAPRFDLDAARKAARSLANIRDPAREGTAVAQFPDKPLETESRAARAIGAAKRRNCKDGLPGGLLGPLLLLADKKDSGCKW